MRIAISTLPLTSAHKDRGIGTYTRELVESLKTYKTKHHFSFFTDPAEIPDDTDVVHYPFFDPFFLTLPSFHRKPTVVTVHDLIPLVFPEHFPRGIRGEVKWQVQKRKLLQATHLITDSYCSKKDIIRLAGIPADRITVVPLAPPATMTPLRDPVKLAETIDRYHLPHCFAMYVGDVNWNKNIQGLLSAWQRVTSRRDLPAGAKLILVGKAFTEPDLLEAKEIEATIKKFRIEDSVIRVGFVPDEDLRALYMLSHVCVFPSLYEGFGLPVVEAFASGLPVIASNTTSIPEVTGDAALLVDPLDIGAISTTMQQLIDGAPLRQRMKIAGWQRAREMTWAKCAKQTCSVYSSLC